MKDGWEVKALGEVCIVKRGTTITKKQTIDGEVPVIGGGTKPTYFHNQPNRDANCITISGSGASAGYVNSWTIPIFASDCSTVETRQDTQLQRFVYYYLLSQQSYIYETLRSGAAQPHVYAKDIAALGFPIVRIEEQKRIVSILDEAFEGLDRSRENAEANLKNARELFESFVSEQLISVNAEEYLLSEMLEKGWITSHLDGNHGGNYPKKSEFISSGVPYISANCIVDGEIDVALSKFLPEERADTLKKGTSYDQDVIFAHNATVGPVSVLKTDQPRVLLGTSLTHYRCNQDRIDPYFLCYEMRSAEFVSQYKRVMGQATRNQVPISIQRSFKHRIPNLKDQMRVSKAARTTEINVKRSLALYQTKLQDISDLRRSLLQKAFAGELT